MTKFRDPAVEQVFASYPAAVREALLALRELLFDVARELDVLDSLEESLKWGEPSYKAHKGSPIRMDWKEQDPQFYRLFFNCQTSLVSSFRTSCPEMEYEGSRAVRLKVGDDIDRMKLSSMARAAMTYHL